MLKKRPRIAQNRKSRDNTGNCTHKKEMPFTNELFKKLSIGETPDFLLFMRAIEETVAFSTKGEQNKIDPIEKYIKESGNKCRYCS